MTLNLKNSSIPTIEFLDTELYKIIPKFIYISVSSKSFKYIPSHTQIIDFYNQNKYDLAYLTGNKAHTKEAENFYNFALKSIPPSSELLIKQLISIASKLYYLENTINDIFNYFITYIPRFYSDFDEELIYEIVETAQLHIFKPHEKCVLFNPKKNLNPIFKQKIQQEEIGKYNTKKVIELAKKGYTQNKISEVLNLNEKTVRNHLKKAKISTKGNKKKNAYTSVQKWREKNEKGTQKQCAFELKYSKRKVEMYWKKKP